MPRTFIKTAIIGVLLVGLSGCAALQWTYNNGPWLAWRWLDGYVDFSDESTPKAKAAIDQWFAWARGSQLPEFATLLVSMQAAVMDPVTPAQVCRWKQLAREKAEPALQRALQLGADLVPMLGEAQWQHIEAQFKKKNDETKRDHMQPRPADRLKAGIKRALSNAETLYGSLDDAQKKVIAAGVAASPFVPELWMAERERRQRTTLEMLRRLVAERADKDRILAGLRVLAEQAETSPDPVYAAYEQRLAEYNCAFAAQIHNATTTTQRQSARERLKGWEDDLRVLIVGP
jgi:hypothetical protein